MSRTQGSWLRSRKFLGGVAAALLLHALLPTHVTPWTQWGRVVLEMAVIPIERPVSWVAGARRRADAIPQGDMALIAKLQADIDFYKTQVQQREDQIEHLHKQMQQLQGGLSVSAGVPVIQIPVPVVGPGSGRSSSVFKVHLGRRQGITEHNAVAVVDGVQLVGHVRPTGAPFLDVIPITDRAAGRLQGMIMLDDLTRGPTCLLQPTGSGTLRGDVEFPTGQISLPELKKGMTVRLSSDGWPDHAQKLVLGTIESIEPKPSNPLRPQIIVKPTRDLTRLDEVIIRALGDVSDAPGPAASGAATAGASK